jgi:hypothetical protein
MVGEVLIQYRSCRAVVDVGVLAGVASALGLMRAVVSEAPGAHVTDKVIVVESRTAATMVSLSLHTY